MPGILLTPDVLQTISVACPQQQTFLRGADASPQSKSKAKQHAPQSCGLLRKMCSKMADCVNSSPLLISRNLGQFGKLRENSGELSGFQWGSVWRLIYDFTGNSWKMSGQRQVFGKFWGGFGDLGSQKAFALDIFETPVTVIPQQEISKTLSSSKFP